MGLPIWKEPDASPGKRQPGKSDPTAAARSPIRRRPSAHRRPSAPSQLHPAPPPTEYHTSARPIIGVSASRSPRFTRRSTHRGVPPISTLLESTSQRRAPLPPDHVRTRMDNAARPPNRPARSERRSPPARSALAIAERILRSPSPGQDDYLTVPRSRFLTRDNTPFHRSPEPMSAADRPQSRSGRGTNLSTPPLDRSAGIDALLAPGRLDAELRNPPFPPQHPLSHAWRAESINGLGDRNRSPTPADGWEVMRTTIAPDRTLPSADSSFTSVAASDSFTSNDTALTEPDRDWLPIDLDAAVDSTIERQETEATAAYAVDMYTLEAETAEGLDRIVSHRIALSREGNRFALSHERDLIEIGFRLIDEALDTEEGRRRVFNISQNRPHEARSFEEWIFSSRNDRGRPARNHSDSDEPPCPHPERHRTTSQEAAREARTQVHDYFRRSPANTTSTRPRGASPPPRYEPLASHPDVDTFISTEGPVPHPVSPPAARRTEREITDALLSGDDTDLNAIRRVVERLAQRDDVPDEWWMSMGLNLSRARVRERSPEAPLPMPRSYMGPMRNRIVSERVRESETPERRADRLTTEFVERAHAERAQRSGSRL